MFIVVELLLSRSGPRCSEHQLIAEPFLIVGIQASIKGIVVLSMKAAEGIGSGEAFRDHCGDELLGVVILLLGTKRRCSAGKSGNRGGTQQA